jgi:hypothetical protein
MLLATSFHNFIEKHNVLQKPTMQISNYFNKHPDLYKVVLAVNHIFRDISMAAFPLILPFSAPVSIGICFAGSLFYRLTVEGHCPYKFALPAFAGATAFLLAKVTLPQLISGVAFTSLSAFAIAFSSLIPLVGYVVYIALTISYDVDNQSKVKCCQGGVN